MNAPVLSRCTVMLIAAFVAVPLAKSEELTWQEANHRSAQLIHDKGYTDEAADLARAAFDLYAESARYDVRNHAQLLLNAVDARSKAGKVGKPKAALAELDRGVERIVKKNGGNEPALLELWQEGIRLILSFSSSEAQADRYYERSVALAGTLWGGEDPRVVKLQMAWARDLRELKGYRWAREKYQAARVAAAKAGENTIEVFRIDLALAALEVEQDSPKRAVPMYRALIERLEARTDALPDRILQSAYAQLEYACGRADDSACAAAAGQRLASMFGLKDDDLAPLVRVQPRYPESAVRRFVEGSVTLRLVVRPDGSVSAASVVESRPPRTFDEAALTAVRQWKFKPKVVDGQPVEQIGYQTLNFRMGH